MKRGFTLVELLAVIVILSVIAIITVPIIGNVIEESKKKALEQSAYGLVSAADYYVVNKLEEKDYHFVFEDGKQTSSDKLDYKGKLDVDGDLYIDVNGDISLCLYNDKYYVIKRNNGGIEIGEKTEERSCAIRPINGKYVAYLTDDGTGDLVTLSDLNSLKSELETKITNNASQITSNTSQITELASAISSIQSIIGSNDLKNDLNTTNKTDLLSAINELNDKINTLTADVTTLKRYASHGPFPYLDRVTLGPNSDLNNITDFTKSYIYSIGNAPANAPVDAATVYVIDGGWGRIQIAFRYTGGNTYVRSYFNNSWSAWKEL